MAELVAQGHDAQRRVWHDLPEHQAIVLGRAPRHGLEVPWDLHISREHASLRVIDGRLDVQQLDAARNPIVYDGHATKHCCVPPHGEFRIGETSFRFELNAPIAVEAPTFVEHTLLGDAPADWFDHAQGRLKALCAMPTLIAETRDDAEFASRVVELLLRSLVDCVAAAVVQLDSAVDGAAPQPKLIRWSSRDDGLARFEPSRRLMARAFQQRQSIVHLWSADRKSQDFTVTNDLDWAFCTPIPVAAHERWCLYVSGRRKFRGVRDIKSPDDLLSDLRLAELMARFIGSVRQIRALEKHQAEMRQFLSPAVVEALMSDRGWESLDPRQGPITVLFCDVRGFSRLVEQSTDQLERLLGRVREALSVMTRSILRYEGVIADFQGDAALGFWGWPAAVKDAPLLACRTALLIHNTFDAAQHDSSHPLHGFRVGIGIGHGVAIAGRIGSEEQVKVGVFGPVVNVTSRLQDLTKHLDTPIVVDGPTAAAVSGRLPQEEAVLRRTGWLRPPGIATAVNVFALTPPREAAQLTLGQRRAFDDAVNALEAGRWTEAAQWLESLPAQDGPASFLKRAIDDYGGRPPVGWDRAFTMAGKESGRMFAAPPPA